jgi:succinate-semialdehyde dehydrogenase/glutarate-semialdehyde dehydrogenase
MPPTVLDEVPTTARILREEVYGPVAPITRFPTEEEAIALANATEFGLAAYVFTATSAERCGSARRSRPAWWA